MFFLESPRSLNLQPSAVTRELSTYDANGTLHKTGIIVKFMIARYASSCSAAAMQADEAVTQGKDAHAQMTSTSRALVPLMQGAFEVSTTIMSNIPTITSNWAPLLEKIKLFTEIVDKISEVRCKIDQLAISMTIALSCRYIHTLRWRGAYCLLHIKYVFHKLERPGILKTR